MGDTWSTSEKKIARRVFDEALRRELAQTLQTFKTMAASATGPDAMWLTEDYLTKARHKIDAKYDYRYSQLLWVFGQLMREGRISEDDLAGLSEEKMSHILRMGKP
jgi:hypothetical protein